MSDERELERHNRILNQISDAKTREELPNVSFTTIASYLATYAYFNKKKISQTLFQPVIDAIIVHGITAHPDVKDAFVKVMKQSYPDVSENDIVAKYNDVMKCKRIGYILSEITQKNLKLDQIVKSENLDIHNQVIKEIKMAYEIKDLPKVGLSELNKKLVKAVNDNDFVTNIKASEIKDLTNAYLNNSGYSELENIIDKICSNYNLNDQDRVLMKEQILGSLMLDETIKYTVEEIALKEKRKYEIYKLDHDATMENIKNATRISQLPPNLTISSVNGYLNGNTTIYTNDDRIVAEDLKRLTDLLMDGYRFEDEVIINEIKRIAKDKYPEKDDAFEILYSKLSTLPKIYYLVEEVKCSQARQTEFIGRACSNVNVYFIPNSKSPGDGGRFYNCYINRVDNLDLSKILPLDLDSIVPPEMDIDSVEWYVQEYYDETFKTAGGIILNKDETIGNVSVFKPNDGTVGVSLEEKEKMDKISDLDEQIKEKEDHLSSLDSEINEKTQKSTEVEARIKDILNKYEQKALALQMELLTNISQLKSEMNVDAEEKKKGI